MNVEETVGLFEKADSLRINFEPTWQEIADYVLPRSANSAGWRGSVSTKGVRNNIKIFDSTAQNGLVAFASVMESMNTPRNSKWHFLKASDPILNKNKNVALWFEEARNRLFRWRYNPDANFSSQNFESNICLGAFGTGGLFIDVNSKSQGLRYSSVPMQNLFILEDHQGRINTVFNRFRYTARQIEMQWGKLITLPEAVMQALEKSPLTEFSILHAVFPNPDMDSDRLDFKGMPFTSQFILLDKKVLLTEGGYNTFPYAIDRYVTAPGEMYGRSPAWINLSAIKVLNEEKKTFLKQGHRITDPALLTHDDGILDDLDMTPGSINAGGMSAEGRLLVGALPTGNLAVTENMMEKEQRTINDGFLVNLFQILIESPQMTATEVLERSKEKGALLGPVMGRQQAEKLGPMITRELDLLAQQGLLPEQPPELIEAKGEFEIIYDSPLSRAQRSEEASGLFRVLELATAHANLTGSPESLDHIDIDEAMPAVADISGVPPSWIRSPEMIQEIRQARADAQQQQQLLDAAPSLASAAKSNG